MKRIIKTKADKKAALDEVGAIMGDGPLMSVEVKEHKETRSQAQNRLLWKWYGELADFYLESTGNPITTESIHEDMKRAFLGCDVGYDVITKQPKVTVKSTAKLKVKEFAEFLDRIHSHAATEWGLTLTIPEDLRIATLTETEKKAIEAFDGEIVD